MDLKPVLLLAVTSLGLMVPVWATPGDITNDGKIDQADLKQLEAFLQGNLLLDDSATQAADYDGDGRVTRRDATALKRHLEGNTAALPRDTPPQATIGLDANNSGRVTDQRTGRPLAGVVVEVPGEDIRVTTDGEGRFTLPRAIPPGRIVTVNAPNYTPFSLTTTTTQNPGAGVDFRLEPLNARTVVLDNRVRHLGDNDYDRTSANASEFRLTSEGGEIRRSFDLTFLPDQEPYLRIGSLIGVDTVDSVRAGQSKLPAYAVFDGSGNAAFRVYLNGSLVKRITLNGDNLVIALPRRLLRVGSNEVVLATGSSSAIVRPNNALSNLFSTPEGGTFYDDIEFANVILVIPGREERDFFRSGP
ncbi:dockerin type I domain-containing protein [Anthocerotibacter panamensis]|uniref:dockerin type I domain-containing protein n=1 Tax=Anthocerotibacter panamensis TaxID=2857077 RepID=UPI001C404EB3|nr:dockerin type I domain-containing protein [Anthocerotibacter panamensis]